MTKILVDAHGGDNAPLEIVKGAYLAAATLDVEIILVGKELEIKKIIDKEKLCSDHVKIINAEQVITMEDDPIAVIKSKKESSMAVAFRYLKNSEADAFVSAGNTGAILVGATMIVKRIKGIKRAALAVIIPTKKGPVMLTDAGANSECKPEYLNQFAVMGSAYMKQVLAVDNPRIGLVNNGTERHKGTPLQTEAFTILEQNENINFSGNIEAREIPLHGCDVAVTDGFTGNVMLKLFEGTAKMFSVALSDLFKKSPITMLGALLVSGGIRDFKKRYDYTEYGGAPLLGISKPVIKAHGSSNAKAIKNAIQQGIFSHQSKMIEIIEKEISQ